MTDLAPLMSSVRDSWNTPANVLDLVRKLAPIELDPCSNPDSLVRATIEYSLEHGQDGLSLPWGCTGLVYVNPPYGRGIKPWVARCDATGTWHRDHTEVVALLPARTDTDWWQSHVAHADAVCFWRGRLTFLGAPNPAPFPSALAYWGKRAGEFRDVFAPHGWTVRP